MQDSQLCDYTPLIEVKYEAVPDGNYPTGLAHETRAMIAIATRKTSKTTWLNEEPAASPEAAANETIANTNIASVMQMERSKAPKPCDCCLHTQREPLITIAKRIKRSMTLSAIPIADRILRPGAK